MIESLPELVELFGPVVGTIVGLFMIPVIIVLWRKISKLEAEKDDIQLLRFNDHKDSFEIQRESILIATKILEITDQNQPVMEDFRVKVRDHITRCDSFMVSASESLSAIRSR